MDNAIEFRRQMRGYNKEDVNNFISKENIRFNKLEESYNRTIKDLERELADLKANIDDSQTDKDKIIELELSITSYKEEISKIEEVISEKDAIIEGLKSAVDSSNEKLEKANSLINELSLRPAVASAPAPAPSVDQAVSESQFSLKDLAINYSEPKEYEINATIIEKAEKYDSICDKVDEILAFAKEEADKIIAEAFEIRKQAVKRNSAQMKNEISARSDSIIDELKKSIRRQMKGQNR